MPKFRQRVQIEANGAQSPLTQSDVSAAKYTVYTRNGDLWQPVSGHTDVSLTVTDAVYDEMQGWTVDATGYNVEVSLDSTLASPFTDWGQEYRVAVALDLPLGVVDGFSWDVRTPS